MHESLPILSIIDILKWNTKESQIYTVCPLLVIVVETREWSLFLLSNDWIDLNEKKPGFFSYLFKCFPMLLPAFTIASYRWTILLYIAIFVFRARAWLNQRSILSAEEGKSFMLKTYSIKVCLLLLSLPASFLYEPRRQNHDIIQFGDTIILQAYTLKPTISIHLLKFNFLIICKKSIC